MIWVSKATNFACAKGAPTQSSFISHTTQPKLCALCSTIVRQPPSRPHRVDPADLKPGNSIVCRPLVRVAQRLHTWAFKKTEGALYQPLLPSQCGGRHSSYGTTLCS